MMTVYRFDDDPTHLAAVPDHIQARFPRASGFRVIWEGVWGRHGMLMLGELSNVRCLPNVFSVRLC